MLFALLSNRVANDLHLAIPIQSCSFYPSELNKQRYKKNIGQKSQNTQNSEENNDELKKINFVVICSQYAKLALHDCDVARIDKRITVITFLVQFDGVRVSALPYLQ